MIAWRAVRGPVDVVITDRWGGVSAAPYAEFNLGDHVGDAPEAVGANRGALAAAVDVPPDRLVFADQVHGRRVVAVEEPWGTQRPASADGLVSTSPDLVLGALVADCVPVLLADPQRGVIAAVHAGRPGMIARIVDAAVDAMSAAGAVEISAVVGPSVCARCYEVPATMRDDAAAVSPDSWAVSATGTPAIDVAAGVSAQLAEHGIPVLRVPGCTRESPHLYSYRRDGRTGRFAGLIRLHRMPRGDFRSWQVLSDGAAPSGAGLGRK